MNTYLALCYNRAGYYLASTQVIGKTPEDAALHAALKISTTAFVDICGQIFKVR